MLPGTASTSGPSTTRTTSPTSSASVSTPSSATPPAGCSASWGGGDRRVPLDTDGKAGRDRRRVRRDGRGAFAAPADHRRRGGSAVGVRGPAGRPGLRPAGDHRRFGCAARADRYVVPAGRERRGGAAALRAPLARG